ncbi:alanine or glycine:cation symporter, AGCS family [Dethiosulfatibacter aminovorans DSM 17477]|uniref:Alanine or glycine:cation symporter, AGCS family n=1 Tax=Dethiosulfatibacter aminovorans DSM 17477 TaxID=1121476 RepID=A0A1M6BR15_9FIRM|nr:amino acid carrier protein [Dethiosulfatibacter aminovorans]SHI51146.1 alanine or glycine:cation symporter, AGCS family [Dethiosulfatibacter aminovorans DSM 17477]
MALMEKIVWEYLWGMPLVLTILFIGIFFTVTSGFFQFRFIPHIFKTSLGRLFGKDTEGEEGTLSSLEALSIAAGATVGVGNIGGVATAIAVGGPGAVFWLIVAGILGQVIKMAEVSLAVYFRNTQEDGHTYGGPTYYISKGLGKERGWNVIPKVLAFIFIFGFGVGFFLTMQNYTVSEAVATTFDMNMIVVSVVYTVLLYLMISGGLPSLGKIASKIVPFMILFYLASGLFVIIKNAAVLPHAFGMIIGGAFNGSAALGGFAGAAFSQVIKIGMSRAVYSNEAGWGSSPMIHASAKTDHPIRQGILGIFEVFLDTIVICTITSLVIIVTGEWSSGLSGAELTLSAFETGIGSFGRIILASGVLLFGITTSSGLYAQIEVLVRYLLGEENRKNKIILDIYKWSYPLPGLLLVVVAVVNEMPGTAVWLFADMSTALPIFANLLSLLLLSGTFIKLLKDYKARYLGIGEVDPEFRVFYDQEDINKASNL